MARRNMIKVFLVILACWAAAGSQAQSTDRVGELSRLDLEYMDQQRDIMQDMATTKLGRQFNGNRERDIELLQSLLDRGLVRADQTRELQAMGVIMGDLLSAQFDLHWVIYEDKKGRSRALRYADSDLFLFPITMIARRKEVDSQTSVADIYQKASAIITANKPALPFQ
jgi:hypothetical protein